jgi:hypothetical protein
MSTAEEIIDAMEAARVERPGPMKLYRVRYTVKEDFGFQMDVMAKSHAQARRIAMLLSAYPIKVTSVEEVADA